MIKTLVIIIIIVSISYPNSAHKLNLGFDYLVKSHLLSVDDIEDVEFTNSEFNFVLNHKTFVVGYVFNDFIECNFLIGKTVFDGGTLFVNNDTDNITFPSGTHYGYEITIEYFFNSFGLRFNHLTRWINSPIFDNSTVKITEQLYNLKVLYRLNEFQFGVGGYYSFTDFTVNDYAYLKHAESKNRIGLNIDIVYYYSKDFSLGINSYLIDQISLNGYLNYRTEFKDLFDSVTGIF